MRCEWKELSVSDKVIIDVIGVLKMSIQSFIIQQNKMAHLIGNDNC